MIASPQHAQSIAEEGISLERMTEASLERAGASLPRVKVGSVLPVVVSSEETAITGKPEMAKDGEGGRPVEFSKALLGLCELIPATKSSGRLMLGTGGAMMGFGLELFLAGSAETEWLICVLPPPNLPKLATSSTTESSSSSSTVDGCRLPGARCHRSVAMLLEGIPRSRLFELFTPTGGLGRGLPKLDPSRDLIEEMVSDRSKLAI